MSDETITVYKLNEHSERVWSYEGVVLERGSDFVRLEARFNRDDMDLGYTTFERGDRFVERFFADRWYNIFEIHSHRDDRVKGWYCNVTRPASITADAVEAADLALDVWVGADGSMRVLDLNEFDALALSTEDREEALKALDELKSMVWDRQEPFDKLDSIEHGAEDERDA